MARFKKEYKNMVVKVSCEYCSNEDLTMSDCIVGLYCNQCEEHITMAEVEIEEVM